MFPGRPSRFIGWILSWEAVGSPERDLRVELLVRSSGAGKMGSPGLPPLVGTPVSPVPGSVLPAGVDPDEAVPGGRAPVAGYPAGPAPVTGHPDPTGRRRTDRVPVSGYPVPVFVKASLNPVETFLEGGPPEAGYNLSVIQFVRGDPDVARPGGLLRENRRRETEKN